VAASQAERLNACGGPFGSPAEQTLYEIHKIAGNPRSKVLTGCRFVPLVASSSS